MNNEIWTFYGLSAVPLVFLPMVTTVKKGLLRKLWIGYCIAGFVLGVFEVLEDKKKDKKDNKDNKDNKQ